MVMSSGTSPTNSFQVGCPLPRYCDFSKSSTLGSPFPSPGRQMARSTLPSHIIGRTGGRSAGFGRGVGEVFGILSSSLAKFKFLELLHILWLDLLATLDSWVRSCANELFEEATPFRDLSLLKVLQFNK